MKQLWAIIALIPLMTTNCSGSVGDYITPETIEFGVSYAVETGTKPLVKHSIEANGSIALSGWKATKQATDELLLPALEGDEMEVSKIDKWIKKINSDSKITSGQSQAIQQIVNMVLSYLDTDSFSKALDKGKVAPRVKKILQSGFSSFSKALTDVLQSQWVAQYEGKKVSKNPEAQAVGAPSGQKVQVEFQFKDLQ